MNFFRMSIYICLGLIAFTLIINFVDGTGAFPTSIDGGTEIAGDEGTGGALEVFTNLQDPDMNAIWGIAVGTSFIGAIGLAWISHSIVPVGIHLFSTVFWTSYIRAWNVMTTGTGLFTEELSGLLTVFTVCILFLFIAAVVGILTGGD